MGYMANAFVDIAALRQKVKNVCREAGLPEVAVFFSEPDRDGYRVIEIVSQPEVDPTDESNAVSWANN